MLGPRPCSPIDGYISILTNLSPLAKRIHDPSGQGTGREESLLTARSCARNRCCSVGTQSWAMARFLAQSWVPGTLGRLYPYSTLLYIYTVSPFVPFRVLSSLVSFPVLSMSQPTVAVLPHSPNQAMHPVPGSKPPLASSHPGRPSNSIRHGSRLCSCQASRRTLSDVKKK